MLAFSKKGEHCGRRCPGPGRELTLRPRARAAAGPSLPPGRASRLRTAARQSAEPAPASPDPRRSPCPPPRSSSRSTTSPPPPPAPTAGTTRPAAPARRTAASAPAAPAGWKLARSRAGASPPAWAQFALPRAGPRTREARFRALKEAPDAVLAAKHDKDKQSARVWRAKRIVADVEDELAGMHVAIGNAADRNGVSPFLVYKALFWARADELSAAEE